MDFSAIDMATSLKAAIYIRVSTEYQVDKDSLQVQRRELIAYCEMVLGIKDYVVFEDPGYSAKNTDRPDYQRMVDRLRTGEFSHLVVWKLDRISRNLLDFSAMYAELKRLGVTFVSKNEQFDTSSAIGEAMLKIILIFAELERNMTSERVTAVMLSRANNKQWNGGRVPYAYDWDKNKKEFTINEAEAKVVKTIYNMYEELQSILYIVRHLNGAGITTRAGKEWSVTAVHKILSNPFYNGTYIYNIHKDGTGQFKKDEKDWIVVEDQHPAIINLEQWERIQFILKRNRRGGVPEGEKYVRKNIHIFAGVTRCNVCGSLMSATSDRRRADGWRPSIYGCSRRRKNSDACSNKYVSDIVIGPFIFNYLANIIRAKNTGKKFSAETLQKKLLQGACFYNVKEIGYSGMEQLAAMLASGETGLEYKPVSITAEGEVSVSEREVLLERKRKNETALSRLQSLFFYGDEGIPEAQYIIAKKNFLDEIEKAEQRLKEIKTNREDEPVADDTFIKKASYFIMVEKLLDHKTVDYEKYIRSIDQTIPRNFIQSIIEKIMIDDGRVKTIHFKNGMVHEFFYND